MSDLADLTARATLEALLDNLSTAVDMTRAAAGRPWEAGEVAAKWLEHELAPLLEAYRAKAKLPRSPPQLHVAVGRRLEEAGASLSYVMHTLGWCPQCLDGEAFVPNVLPCDVSYTCGHVLRISKVYADFTEEQLRAIVERMQAAAARVEVRVGEEEEPRVIRIESHEIVEP